MKVKGLTALGVRRARGVSAAGFSLIEMLVVVAIIGIMAGIMVPSLTGLNDSASQYAKDRRNAQNLASVFLSAQVAGHDFLVPGDVAATIEGIVAGGTPTEGVFAGNTFVVPGLNPDDKTGAAVYLKIESGMLVYDSDPAD